MNSLSNRLAKQGSIVAVAATLFFTLTALSHAGEIRTALKPASERNQPATEQNQWPPFDDGRSLWRSLTPGQDNNFPPRRTRYTPSEGTPGRTRPNHPAGGTTQPRWDNSDYFPSDDSRFPTPEPEPQPKKNHELTVGEKLSRRYLDPEMVRFSSSLSYQQITALYLEASNLIDERHVRPPAHRDRVHNALQTLGEALGNTAFLRAAGVTANPGAIQTAQSQLASLARSQKASSAREAVTVIGQAADIVSRNTGIRRELVAMEFVHATIDSLDQYSAIVPTHVPGRPSASLDERIVGIGVELKAHELGAKILGVLEGGPALEGGLRVGDIVTGVNGQNTRGMSLNQVADMISGPAGSVVLLKIDRGGREQTLSLRRRSVYVSSVTGARIINEQDGIGYIRLKQFSESTADDLEKALWTLYRQGMKALVLDLRGNPGGLLTQAIAVSDKFLPGGSIVSTKGRTYADNTSETATFEKTWRQPLVVLVDEHSASASEIFAAAIQDNGRGIIVGRSTYGKGTVQTHFPLQSISGNLKLTTAMFYSPKGREMAGAGVTPDVRVRYETNWEVAAERDEDVVTAIDTILSGQPTHLAGQAGRVNHSVSKFNF